ncbi:MAG: putative peptidoglycan binding domain-containing protein [Actinomycetota bacterium]
MDLRVDDHPAPVDELARLWDIHSLLFPRPESLEFVPIDEELAGELRYLLSQLGYDAGRGGGTPYDDDLKSALYEYVGTENLEERWSDEPVIERRVLEHLRDR